MPAVYKKYHLNFYSLLTKKKNWVFKGGLGHMACNVCINDKNTAKNRKYIKDTNT